LARVEMRCAIMRKSADRRHRIMVVQDFSGKKVDFTRERQADDKNLRPVTLSRFDEASQSYSDCLWPEFKTPGHS